MKKHPLPVILSFIVIVSVGFGVGCEATAPAPISPTATPGLGVPITLGDWEITLTEAKTTTTWQGSHTKEGHMLILVDLTIHNLNLEQTLTIATEEAQLIVDDGVVITTGGVINGENSHIETINGQDMTDGVFLSTSCLGCAPVFASTQDTIQFTLVFGATEDQVSQPLIFQFQEWRIPFQLN